MEKVQYSSRAELFKIHFHVYQVLNHIIPPTKTLTATAQAIIKDVQAAEIDPELWSHLAAILLQWIYGTISNDLLHTIIETNVKAQQAWERLASI